MRRGDIFLRLMPEPLSPSGFEVPGREEEVLSAVLLHVKRDFEFGARFVLLLVANLRASGRKVSRRKSDLAQYQKISLLDDAVRAQHCAPMSQYQVLLRFVGT